MANSIIDNPLPLRDFSQKNISEYILKLNELNENHGQNANLQASVEGFNMYRSKFINDVKFSEDNLNGTVEIFSLVRAKYKKRIYNVNAVIDILSNEVLSASCECPGGVMPSGCKHVFAVLSLLQEYCIKELYNAPTEVIQKWHAPSKKKKFEAMKIAELYPKDGKNMNHDCSPVNFDALKNLSKNAPLFSVLNDPKFDVKNVIYAKSIPLPAIVLVDGLYRNLQVPEDLDLNELFFFHENIKKSLIECFEIEMRTLEQDDDFWQRQRLLRLTSSNFHQICRSTDETKTSLSLLNPKDLSNIPAVSYGKSNEKKAKHIIGKIYSNLDFRNVGLVIHPLLPYLGASPDGFLYGDEAMVVEVKCVYNKEKLPLSELCKRADFCLRDNEDGTYSIKETHRYYYQIQGQMAISNINTCLFAVFYNFQEKPFLQKVKFDENLWKKIFEKLKIFYFNVHLKNIVQHMH